MRHHYMHPGKAKIKKTDSECWWGCGATRTCRHCWWNHIQRSFWQLLIKLKLHLPHSPAIPLMEIYLRKMNTMSTKYYVQQCLSSPIHNRSKLKKNNPMSTNRRVEKQVAVLVYPCNDSVVKGMTLTALWLNLWNIILSKIIPHKRIHSVGLIYRKSMNSKTNYGGKN